jgi:glutamate racemase
MPATHDPRPIGVFDSGIGGLTSVREIFRVLPAESVIYFGDTARLPYGAKSRETVTRFSLEIASFLVRQNIKCLLVACNTASSYALETLSQRLEVPVIGVIEPAGRAAVAAAPHGRIGVIGTSGTVGSGAYPTMIEGLAPGAAVISRACPLFVPLVEEGWIDHRASSSAVRTIRSSRRSSPTSWGRASRSSIRARRPRAPRPSCCASAVSSRRPARPSIASS